MPTLQTGVSRLEPKGRQEVTSGAGITWTQHPCPTHGKLVGAQVQPRSGDVRRARRSRASQGPVPSAQGAGVRALASW